MVNKQYFEFVKELADHGSFRTVLAASQEQIERQRHLEYASRFLVHTYIPYDGKRDIEDYFDWGMIQLASEGPKSDVAEAFHATFDLLDSVYGREIFRKREEGRAQGRVSLAAFECIAVGVSKNLPSIRRRSDPVAFIRKKIDKLWRGNDLEPFFAAGLTGTARIQQTIPYGQKLFAS